MNASKISKKTISPIRKMPSNRAVTLMSKYVMIEINTIMKSASHGHWM